MFPVIWTEYLTATCMTCIHKINNQIDQQVSEQKRFDIIQICRLPVNYIKSYKDLYQPRNLSMSHRHHSTPMLSHRDYNQTYQDIKLQNDLQEIYYSDQEDYSNQKDFEDYSNPKDYEVKYEDACAPQNVKLEQSHDLDSPWPEKNKEEPKKIGRTHPRHAQERKQMNQFVIQQEKSVSRQSNDEWKGSNHQDYTWKEPRNQPNNSPSVPQSGFYQQINYQTKKPHPSINRAMKSKFESFANQEAMRRSQRWLDQQLYEYSMRNSQTASMRSAKSARSASTNHMKQQEHRVSRKKKRVNIDDNVIKIVVDLLEIRKNNPLITLENIAQKANLGYSTICKLYKEWSKDSSMVQRKYSLQKFKDKKQQLTAKRTKALQYILYMNPYLTQGEMVDQMNKIDTLKTSKGCITRFIIYDLLKTAGFVKKRGKKAAYQRNKGEVKQLRYDYCRRYKELTSNQNENVFFIGQLVLNLYGMRYEGWCKREQELVIRCPKARNKNVSAVFIVYRNGSFMSQVKLGSLERTDFYLITNRLMKEVGQNFPVRTSVLIIDPANLHTNLDVGELRKNTNCQVLSIPPFSPQLSIVQYFFHQVRSKLRTKKLDSQAALKEELEKVIREDQSRKFAYYFQRTKVHIEEGIQLIDF